MVSNIVQEGLSYADVLIVPEYSNIVSRNEVDISVDFLGLRIKPIIAAPMDYVVGTQMIISLYDNGYYGIFPRFGYDIRDAWSAFTNEVLFGIAIGAKNPEKAYEVLMEGPLPHSICIDVAHGDHSLVLDMIHFLKYKFKNTWIIAGNVATAAGYRRLANAGADAIRVGIGAGSACTTRGTTGAGVPQLTAVLDCAEEKGFSGPSIIADGGIETSGDIVKALAAGADVVMLGKLLAGHDESPGLPININGTIMKAYRGQSLLGSNGARKAPEGIAGYVPARGKVSDTLAQMEGWIKSGFSYVGARNIEELREAQFIKISQAAQKESHIRILEV